MDFTLDVLREQGGFTGGPVKREVEWIHNGEKVNATVWIRPMSYRTAVKDLTAISKGGDVVAHRLAMCVCHEDGSPVFQVSDITGLDENGFPVKVKDDAGKEVERGPLNRELADALMLLVSEVSELGKTRKSSRRSKSSGTT